MLKRENVFIKLDISINKLLISENVQQFVALMSRRISKENARNSLRLKLVTISRSILF